MIVVKLQGGLGNQMFQYSAGRVLSLRHKTGLILDKTWFKTSNNRIFWLKNFKIPANIIEADLPKNALALTHFTETKPGFDYAFSNLRDNVFLDGYFQSYKYFSEIREEIKKEFVLKSSLGPAAADWLSRIKISPSVSIHVRRGDYLWEKHLKILGLVPPEFYEKAAAFLSEETTEPAFYVFSDDIEWARHNLKLPPSTSYVSASNVSVPEEMFLMSSCSHNIIANSTFSWWAAWLNEYPDKIVITPESWFLDKSREPVNLIPDNWVKI